MIIFGRCGRFFRTGAGLVRRRSRQSHDHLRPAWSPTVKSPRAAPLSSFHAGLVARSGMTTSPW